MDNLQRIYDKINKATENDMLNIAFWYEIVNICNDVRKNATSLQDLSQAEQYFTRATFVIQQLGGEI